LGGSIVCSGLLQGDARLETKGSGVSVAWLIFKNIYTTTVYNNDRLTAFDPGQPG